MPFPDQLGPPPIPTQRPVRSGWSVPKYSEQYEQQTSSYSIADLMQTNDPASQAFAIGWGYVGSMDLKKKIGPLPVWAWGLILGVVGYFAYERYSAGSSSSSGTASTTGILDPNAVDPNTGLTYGQEEAAAENANAASDSGAGSGGGTAVSPTDSGLRHQRLRRGHRLRPAKHPRPAPGERPIRPQRLPQHDYADAGPGLEPADDHRERAHHHDH